MTLEELLAKNAATHKRRMEKAAKDLEKQKETDTVEEVKTKSKKGRKPKNRVYLVHEELPFEEEEKEEVVVDKNLENNDTDIKIEEE